MDNKSLSDTLHIYNIFSNHENMDIQFIFQKDLSNKNQKKKPKNSRKRIPGIYPDIFSLKKEENNIFILHACKLLKAYYNEGIKALILDGYNIRTTKKLLNLKNRLKELIIVEYNKDTFYSILEKIKLYKNIKCFNGHINDYLENKNDPEINVVYFDLMENFFSSGISDGSDYAINQFLYKSDVKEIIFAATFCLRTINNMDFKTQVEKILLGLELIFKGNLFNYKILVKKQDMRYKGQRAPNKALMFVLYLLEKDNNNNDNKEENNYCLFK